MPFVSIVMCNYNCAAYIASAIESALHQRDVEVEVIVVDDGSTDDSRRIVEDIARLDPRVRFMVTPENLGPAGARNIGLAASRGEWIAIQDSDDLMHPERLARLIALAAERGVDIVADDVLVFDDARRLPARALVDGYWSRQPVEIGIEAYIASNGLYGRAPVLGYLKPVFRTALFSREGFRYNEIMRVAEDFDLVMRLMAAGKRFLLSPDLTYFYRKRTTSISHRLSPATVAPMLTADRQFREAVPALAPSIRHALDGRLASITRALGYEELIDCLKDRDFRRFFRVAAAGPASLALLRLPVMARVERIFDRLRRRPAAVPQEDGEKNLVFVSRQRIVGRTNGSSTYALGILEALGGQGLKLHYLCPSPAVFGSWPVLKLGPDMRIFDTITIRGAIRFRAFVIATDPRIAIRAAGRVLERVAMKLKLIKAPLLGPAPYSIAVPLGRRDQVFLASTGPQKADVVLCDYAFLTAALPFLLRPQAPSMVLMHDLFSARKAQFSAIGATDSVASLDLETEMRMLGAADRVIAIQSHEGAVVAHNLGADRVIVAPMAMQSVAAPQPGTGRSVLFVGSNTAPNVDALSWFLADIWPRVLAEHPDAVFDIVGGVGSVVKDVPAGVRIHGLVADLQAFYTPAGVVVSPLRVGSGLKIKLVEALAQGKAIVATSVTCQGVEAQVDGAVIVADEAADMAAQLVRLLRAEDERAALAGRALDAARLHFGPEACYGGVIDYATATSGRDRSDHEKMPFSKAGV